MSFKLLVFFVFLFARSEALLGPCTYKNVSLMSGVSQKPIVTPTNCGVTLNASELVTRPNVILHSVDESRERNESYTFMLLEEIPDVRDVFKLHWLVSHCTPLKKSLTANETAITLLSYERPVADPHRPKKFFLYVYKQAKSPRVAGPSGNDIQEFAPQKWVSKNGHIIQDIVGGAEFYVAPNFSKPAIYNTHGGPVAPPVGMPIPQQPHQHIPNQPGYPAQPQPGYPAQPGYTAHPLPGYPAQPQPGYPAQPQPQPGQLHPTNQQPTVINNYYGKQKDDKKKKNSATAALPMASLVALLASAVAFRM